MEWLLCFGLATGMRTMTAVAVLCCYAALGYTPTHGWAFWVGYKVSAVIFALCALGEYYGDTLPKTPNRTDPPLAAARIVFGSLAGAIAANIIHEPAAGGIILGFLGALIGTWGGIRYRAWLTSTLRHPLPAALLDSATALAIALWSAHELAWAVFINSKWWA
jgi:uncharacterized membrane protein